MQKGNIPYWKLLKPALSNVWNACHCQILYIQYIFVYGVRGYLEVSFEMQENLREVRSITHEIISFKQINSLAFLLKSSEFSV